MDISFGSSDWNISRDLPSSTNQTTDILQNMETGRFSTDELLAEFCMKSMVHNKEDVTSDDRLNMSCSLSSSTGSLDRMDTQSDSSGPDQMSYMSESESESDTLIDNHRKESTSNDLGFSFGFFHDGKDHGPGSGDVSTYNDVGDDNFILCKVKDNHRTTSRDSNISFGFFEDCDFSNTNKDQDISASSLDSVDTASSVSDKHSSTSEESESDTLEDNRMVDNRTETTSRDFGLSFGFFDDYDCGDDLDHCPDTGDDSISNDDDILDNSILCAANDNYRRINPSVSSKNKSQSKPIASSSSIHIRQIPHGAAKKKHSSSTTSTTITSINRDHSTAPIKRLSMRYLRSLLTQRKKRTSRIQIRKIPHCPVKKDKNLTTTTTSINRDHPNAPIKLLSLRDLRSLPTQEKKRTSSNRIRKIPPGPVKKDNNPTTTSINATPPNKHFSLRDLRSLPTREKKVTSDIHIRKIPHGPVKKDNPNTTNTPTTTSINRDHPTEPIKPMSSKLLHSLSTQEKKGASSIYIRKIPHGPVKTDNHPIKNIPTTTSINRDHPTEPIKPMSPNLLHSLYTLGKKRTRVTAKVSKSTNKEENSEQENTLFWFDFYPDYLEKENFKQFYHDRHLYPCSHGFDPQLCYCQSPWRYKPTTTVEFSTQYPSPPSNSSSISLSHPTQDKKLTKINARVQYRERFVKVTAL